MEQELADTNESLSELTCQNQAIQGAKMKCEQEMSVMSHDVDEMQAEAVMSEEKATRYVNDKVRQTFGQNPPKLAYLSLA